MKNDTYIDKDYRAKDADHQVPVISPIGRGPQGDSITAEIVETGYEGDFKFVIKRTSDGSVLFTSENLSAGTFGFTQDTVPTIAGEDAVGHFTQTKDGVTTQYQVNIPPGAPGSNMFGCTNIKDNTLNSMYVFTTSELIPKVTANTKVRVGDSIVFPIKEEVAGGVAYSMGMAFVNNVLPSSISANLGMNFPLAFNVSSEIQFIDNEGNNIDGSFVSFSTLTKDQYDALTTINPDRFYICTDTGDFYLGTIHIEDPTSFDQLQNIINNLGDELSDNIQSIENLIPAQANTSNQLADKDFVNSSINAMAAFRVYKDNALGIFQTRSELQATTTFYDAAGNVHELSTNDYTIVMQDEGAPAPFTNGQTRWRVVGGSETLTFDYGINETPFTAAQQAAIDSGATAAGIASIDSKADKPTGFNGVNRYVKTYSNANNSSDVAIESFSSNSTPTSGQIIVRQAGGHIKVSSLTTPPPDSVVSKLYVDTNAVDSANNALASSTVLEGSSGAYIQRQWISPKYPFPAYAYNQNTGIPPVHIDVPFSYPYADIVKFDDDDYAFIDVKGVAFGITRTAYPDANRLNQDVEIPSVGSKLTWSFPFFLQDGNDNIGTNVTTPYPNSMFFAYGRNQATTAPPTGARNGRNVFSSTNRNAAGVGDQLGATLVHSYGRGVWIETIAEPGSLSVPEKFRVWSNLYLGCYSVEYFRLYVTYFTAN